MKKGFMQALRDTLKKTAQTLFASEQVPEQKKEKPVETEQVNPASANETFVRDISECVPTEDSENQISQTDNVKVDENGAPVVTLKHDLLVRVLKSQDELLDSILKEQGKLHKNVKNRKWENLQASISNLQVMSDRFVALDDEREKIAGDDRGVYFDQDVEPVLVSLRSKLAKSKIENEALRNYVGATKDFIGNIIEECFVKRGSTYSASGKMVRPEIDSMLVNTEM